MKIFKSPRDSEIKMALLMQPSNANFSGNVHGGYILSLMDQAAYACASKHSQSYCVTASVDTVNFRTPINVGDLITIRARVNYVGKTSMVVGIRVETENLIEASVRHSNSSYFTMVAKDEIGKPKKVPGLILENLEDVRRFVRAHKNKKNQKDHSKLFNEKQFTLTSETLVWLKTQNTQIDASLF